MGKQVITIETAREGYAPSQLIHSAMTIGQLIDILSDYDEDAFVMFSNDNGYTYGNIKDYSIQQFEDEYGDLEDN